MLLHRWEAPWHWLFYGTLIASTAIAAADEEAAWRRLAMLGVGALLALWYWRMVVRGRCLSGSLPWVLANLVLATALWVPLLLWNGIFLIMMFSAYSLVCSLPLRGAIPGVAAVSALVVATTSVRAGSFDALLALIYLVVTVAIVLLVVMVRGIERQSAERKQLIDELEATREELAESERQAGVLAERQRLAREIHDTLAQGFTSIVALHEAARAESASRPEVALRHLEEASRTARESLTEARRFVRALRPEALEAASLATALDRLAERFRSETGIDARAVVTGTERTLGPEKDATLLRVAQEALANVRKHAAASRVALTLSYMDEATLLDIRDDGAGFDPDLVQLGSNGWQSGGFGLAGMRERVEECGGTITIESASREGTTVVVSLPRGTPGPSSQGPAERDSTTSQTPAAT